MATKQKKRKPRRDAELERQRAARLVERAPAYHREVLGGFRRWLSEDRALSPATVHARLRCGRNFLAWAAGARSARTAIRRLKPDDIRRFATEFAETHGMCSQRTMHASLRLLLRFAFEQGWVERGLSAAVPVVSASGAQPVRAWHAERALRLLKKVPADRRCVLEQFTVWLRVERELSPASVVVVLRAAVEFVASVASGGPLRPAIRRLAAARVEEFFVSFHQSRGRGALRNMQGAMRLFLRFCVSQGWVAPSLVSAVPTIHCYRLSTVPRGLSDEQISAVLVEIARDDVWLTAARVRDRAILLLLATYGVRRCQVAALRLNDLNWEDRRIHFGAHKGGKPVTHALTAPVAMAIARYVDCARPRVPVSEVFVRARPPHLPLRPAAVSSAVRARLLQAGVVATPCGPHAFRHAFATRLLGSGQSLKVVADLLGHRDLTSAAVYAKVDLRSLRQVAVEWPEVLS